MIYVFIILYIIICIFKYDIHGKDKGKKGNYNLVLGILIIISGLSYRLGSDVVYYMDAFSRAKTLPFSSLSYFFSLENGHLPGWMFLVSLSKTICNHFNFLKFIIAIFVNYSFFIAIRRYTNYIFTGVLFYFIFLYFIINFEILRFSISVAIFFLSLKHLEEKKLLKYFSYVFLATLFHEGSLLLLIVPFLSNIVINKFKSWTLLIIMLSIMFSASFFRERLEILSLIGLFEHKVDIYMNAEGAFAAKTGISFLTIVKMFLLYGIPLVLLPSINKINNKRYVPYFIMYLFAIVLGFILPIALRFAIFFTLFYYIYLIDLLIVVTRRINLGKSVRNILVGFLIFVLLMNQVLTEIKPQESLFGMSSFTRYYPYASIIDQNVDSDRERLYDYLSTYGF